MKRGEIVGCYKKHLRLKRYSPRTEECYLSQLHLYLDYIKSEKKSISDKNIISSYLAYLEKGNNVSYPHLKQVHAAINLLYKKVLKSDAVIPAFTETEKKRSLPIILSRAEIKKIIDSIGNLKHKTILATIYSCGLRISEAVNLEIVHINLSEMSIKVSNEKRKNFRTVMLSECLSELLRKYMKEYKPKKYLFDGKSGNKYSVRSIQEIFNKAVRSAGISKKVTVGTLRHSFAVHLLDSGTDIRLIQELLGHRHLSTTLIYTYISPPSAQKIKSPFDLTMFKIGLVIFAV